MKHAPAILKRTAVAAVLVFTPIAALSASKYVDFSSGHPQRTARPYGREDTGGQFGPVSGDFAQRLLASHNTERERVGMAPLRWNARLSNDAQRWAEVLARQGTLEHSDDDNVGENLWMGSARLASPERMVGDFLSERSAFHPGRFPNVSRTGDWSDVGHYTQIIWPQTRDVGCALAQGGREEVLVCRYWPAGNVEGERVG